MITEGMLKNVQNHKDRGHRLEYEPDGEVQCLTCNTILAWHVPDQAGLSQANNDLLFVKLAIRYNKDSDVIEQLLMENGFEVLSDDNVAEAIELVKDHFTKGA